MTILYIVHMTEKRKINITLRLSVRVLLFVQREPKWLLIPLLN